MTKSISGRCLCGAVSFSADAVKSEVAVCHCSMCQRQVAGPFLAMECVPGSLGVEGADKVVDYNSSPWAKRSFCKLCGSALFWQSLDGKYVFVSAGALDEKSGLSLASEIFIDEKPGYYDFVNPTQRMTGPEFIAMMTGGAHSD